MSEVNWWNFLSKNWGKILGGLLGLIFAVLVINYGFWLSLFIFLCIAVGLVIGWRLDATNGLSRFINRYITSRDDH